MKRIYILYIIVYCILCVDFAYAQRNNLPIVFSDPGKELFDQGFDTTNMNLISTLIDTNNYFLSSNASLFLAEHGDRNHTPEIKSQCILSLQSSNSYALTYLYSLYLLGDTANIEMTQSYLDTVIHESYKNGFVLSYEIDYTISILLNQGDYSRYSQYTRLLHNSFIKGYTANIKILMAFSNKSELKDSVFEEIKSQINNTNENVRFYVVLVLPFFIEKIEVKSLLEQIMNSDSSFEVRDEASWQLLSYYNDSTVLPVCEGIADTTFDSTAYLFQLNHIADFPSVDALQYLKNIQAVRNTGYFHDLVTIFINGYTPAVLRSLDNVGSALDTLLSYVGQTYTHQWIGDSDFVFVLDSIILSAKNALTLGDSVSCSGKIRTIEKMLDSLGTDSGDKSYMSDEGWKIVYPLCEHIFSSLPRSIPLYSLWGKRIGNGRIIRTPYHYYYDSGTEVVLTARPGLGYYFSNWSGDVPLGHELDTTFSILMDTNKSLQATFNPYKDTMNSDKTITAKFSSSTFTITTTTEGAGKIVSGTPPVTFNLERPNPAIESGSQTFTENENESLYLLVLPAEGYDIDTVATDGVRYTAFLTPKGGAGLQDMQLRWPVYMFENIKANHFLHARFKRSK